MWHIWPSPAPLPASRYKSRKVMAYLVVGKCSTSGNPLHRCLLQVISPEWLWLTWLLVNVAHLAIPCTAACFKFRLLWFIRSTRISACFGASPTLGFCVSISVSVISNCDQLWVSVSSCSFRSSSYWAFKASGETVSNSTAAKTIKHCYCKCSKISNTFLFPFSNKLLAIGVWIHKMFVRIS